MKAYNQYTFGLPKKEDSNTFSLQTDFSKDKLNKQKHSKSLDYNNEYDGTKDSSEEFWDDVKVDTVSDMNAEDLVNRSRIRSEYLNTTYNYVDDSSKINYNEKILGTRKASLNTYVNTNVNTPFFVTLSKPKPKQRHLSQDNKKCQERETIPKTKTKANTNKLPTKIYKNDKINDPSIVTPKKPNRLSQPPVNKGKEPKPVNTTGKKNSVSLSSNPSNSSNPSHTFNSNRKPLELINSLYQKDKKKEEKLKQLREENEQIKALKEIENCTFRPKINNFQSAKKNISKEGKELTIYERTQLWHNRKSERLVKEMNIAKLQEDLECTFAPEISKKQVEFENIPKTIDKPTRKYIERVNNAKKMKEEINSKLNPDYNEMYEKLCKNKANKIVRMNKVQPEEEIIINNEEIIYGTFNQKAEVKTDFDTWRQGLHSKLHSLNLQEQGDNEN